jgi:sulfhydrogenase subunit beta (sulfur reductase)
METFISKDKVAELARHLMKGYRVVAPVPKGPTAVFSEISAPDKVKLDYTTTVLPPKKYFIPSKEELLRFDRGSGKVEAATVESAPTVFLGVHNYDMQGILRLDLIMKDGTPDKGYIARRKNTHFIGVAYTPDEQHFSESVGIPAGDVEGFDAFLFPAEGGWLLKTLTPEGGKLMEGFAGGGKASAAPLNANFQRKIMPDISRVPSLLDKAYNSATWKNAGEKCLSCGSCNLVCPTCYCFDVEDDVALNLTDGARTRMWDACQLTSFAEVAGGENFRNKRESRVRHRVYRKFRYLAEKYPKPFCVGCGRCNRACTAKINIVEMLNDAAVSV